jgi:hypothetical protein
MAANSRKTLSDSLHTPAARAWQDPLTAAWQTAQLVEPHAVAAAAHCGSASAIAASSRQPVYSDSSDQRSKQHGHKLLSPRPPPGAPHAGTHPSPPPSRKSKQPLPHFEVCFGVCLVHRRATPPQVFAQRLQSPHPPSVVPSHPQNISQPP